MSVTRYKSDVIYKEAVLHFYVVAWVASMFTLIPLGLIGVKSGMNGVYLMLMLIVAQNIQWIVIGALMCANFRVMSEPYNPPPPPEKTSEYDIPTSLKGKETEKTRVTR